MKRGARFRIEGLAWETESIKHGENASRQLGAPSVAGVLRLHIPIRECDRCVSLRMTGVCQEPRTNTQELRLNAFTFTSDQHAGQRLRDLAGFGERGIRSVPLRVVG